MLNQKTICPAIVCAMLIGLQACSSDSTSEPEMTDGEADETSQPAPGVTPGVPLTLEGLEGSWQRSTCLASATDASVYTNAGLTIADNVASLTINAFTDSACSSPASPAVTLTESSLVFDGSTSTTTLGEASHFDSTVESKTVDGVDSNDSINSISYDIALIINDTLYFGDTQGSNDGSSSELRPTTLDEQSFFTR